MDDLILPQRKNRPKAIFTHVLATLGLAEILFLGFASLEEVLTLRALFKATKSRFVDTSLLRLAHQEATATNGKNLTALLHATREAAKKSIKALAFLSFYFDR